MTENLELFKHKIGLETRFMDIDALHHVNNARYLNFLEEARIAYCRDVLDITFDIKNFNVLVARIEIDFLQPILFQEKIEILTRVSKLGNKSFQFESLIIVNTNSTKKLAAKAIQTLVTIDPIKGVTVSIPDEMRNKISAFDKL